MATPPSSPYQPRKIPEDVASCIAQFVRDNEGFHEERGLQRDLRDLYAFCLVDRSFYATGLPHLYNKISLGYASRFREKDALEREILLCRTLVRRPQLAAYVRDLSFDLSWLLEGEAWPLPTDWTPTDGRAPAICRLYFRTLYKLNKLKSLQLHLMLAIEPLVPNFLRCPAHLASFTFTSTMSPFSKPPMYYLIDLLKQPLFIWIQQLSIRIQIFMVGSRSDHRFDPVLRWLKTNPSELANLARVDCRVNSLSATFSEAAPGRPIKAFQCHQWYCGPPEWQEMLKNLSLSSGPLLRLGIRCDNVCLEMLSDIPRYLPHLVELVILDTHPQHIESTYTSTTGRSVHFNALKSLVLHLFVGHEMAVTRDQVNPFYAWKIISPFALVLAAGTPTLASISTDEHWTIEPVDENTEEEGYVV